MVIHLVGIRGKELGSRCKQARYAFLSQCRANGCCKVCLASAIAAMKDEIAYRIVGKLHRLEIGFRLPRPDKVVKRLIINTVLFFPPTAKPGKCTMVLLHLP